MNRHARASLRAGFRGLTGRRRLVSSARVLSIYPKFEFSRSHSTLTSRSSDVTLTERVQSLSADVNKLIAQKPARSVPELQNAWHELQKQTLAYQELVGRTAFDDCEADIVASLEKLHSRMHFLYLSLFDNIHKLGSQMHWDAQLDEPVQQIMEREANEGIEFGLSAPSDTIPLLQLMYDSLVGAISIGAVPDARSAESMLRIAGLHSISDAFSLYFLFLQAGVPASRTLDSVLIYLSVKHRVPEVVLPLFLYRSLDRGHPSDDDIIYLLSGIQNLDDLDDAGDSADDGGLGAAHVNFNPDLYTRAKPGDVSASHKHTAGASPFSPGTTPLWGEESPRNATFRPRADVPLATPYHFPKLYVGLRARLSLLLSHLIGITKDEIQDMRDRWSEVQTMLEDAGISMPTPSFLASGEQSQSQPQPQSQSQEGMEKGMEKGVEENAPSAAAVGVPMVSDAGDLDPEKDEEEIAEEMRAQGFQEIAPGIWWLDEDAEEKKGGEEEEGTGSVDDGASTQEGGEGKPTDTATPEVGQRGPSETPHRLSASTVHFSVPANTPATPNTSNSDSNSNTNTSGKATWERELDATDIDEPKAEIVEKLGKEASWWRERIRSLFNSPTSSDSGKGEGRAGQENTASSTLSSSGGNSHHDGNNKSASDASALMGTASSTPKDSIQVHELHQSLQEWLSESPYGTPQNLSSLSPVPSPSDIPASTSLFSSPGTSSSLQLDTDMNWMLFSARYTLHTSRIQQQRYRALLAGLLHTLGFRLSPKDAEGVPHGVPHGMFHESAYQDDGLEALDAQFRAPPHTSGTTPGTAPGAASVSVQEGQSAHAPLASRILDLLQDFSASSFTSHNNGNGNEQSPEYRAMHETLLALCAEAAAADTEALGAIPQSHTQKDPRLDSLRTRIRGVGGGSGNAASDDNMELDGVNADGKRMAMDRMHRMSNVVSLLLQTLPYLERNAYSPYVQLDDARAIDTSRQCDMDIRRHRFHHHMQLQLQQQQQKEQKEHDVEKTEGSTGSSRSSSALGAGTVDLDKVVSLAKHRSRHHLFADTNGSAGASDSQIIHATSTSTSIAGNDDRKELSGIIFGDVLELDNSEWKSIENEVEAMPPFVRKQMSLALASTVMYR